jgi:hypothetical protein
MLLQNRNAFGHAFIKDIAGNAGDKPPDVINQIRGFLIERGITVRQGLVCAS